MGWAEIAVVMIVGLLVFGPDRLPHMAKQAGGFVRTVRKMAEDAKNDLGREMGHDLTGLKIEDLDPRVAVRRAILDEPATKPRSANGPTPQGTPRTSTPFDPDAT